MTTLNLLLWTTLPKHHSTSGTWRQVESTLSGQGFNLSLHFAGSLLPARRRDPSQSHVVCGHLFSTSFLLFNTQAIGPCATPTIRWRALPLEGNPSSATGWALVRKVDSSLAQSQYVGWYLFTSRRAPQPFTVPLRLLGGAFRSAHRVVDG